MNRFFVDRKNILEERMIVSDQEDVKHIIKVLRLTEGSCIEICDGENNEYIGKIVSVSKKEVILDIVEKRESKTEPPIFVTLFQGIPKSSKMDMIIQKCTELGIGQIQPMVTERTVIKLKDEKSGNKKVERWQKISDSAAKQCKRGRIPKVNMPISFKEVLDLVSEYDLAIIPYENEENRGLKNILRSNNKLKKVAIMIGPEGGFEEAEIIAAKSAGIIPVTLGPRILRTETAGFVALSVLMYEIGDLGGVQ